MSGVLSGVVLAGGEGRRMGRRKEEVRLLGRPLLAYAWNAVAPVAGGAPVLQGVGRAPEGLVASEDERRNEGPLAGIETALGRAAREGRAGVALVAVDLPRVPASLVAELVRRWRSLPDPTDRAVVLRDGDRVQPLVGVYGAGLAPRLTEWLDRGTGRAVHDWIADLGDRVERVDPGALPTAVGHGHPLFNVNRPADLAEAANLPAPAPPMLSVVGWKNAGKTTVASGLVASLESRGWRVMALKHGHHFRLDTEGTDSTRLREAGAERVLLAGPDGMGLLGDWGAGGDEPEAVELAARYLGDADVVVVEGWKASPLPAIEVCRGAHEEGDPPLWSAEGADRDRFLARVGVEAAGEADGWGPALLDRGAPDLGARLADVVEARVIPGWRP